MLKLPRILVVCLLFLINLLNYMDRLTIAGILSELQLSPSEGGFGITDNEAGILSSIFVSTYMVLSPVFGFLGDRVPRKIILAVGVLVWAVSTMLCSFASSYSELLVFRSMVGFGEASYATIAPTLIADFYPVEQRATALAFYFTATPLGSALGYLVAGEMAYLFNWRWAFRVTPPLAILFTVILFFFAEEPPRGATEVVPLSMNDEAEDDSVDGDKLNLRDFLTDLRLIWAIRSFAYSTFAFTAITFVSGAISGWGPTFLQRMHCTDAADAGRCKSEINYKFGIIGSITGVAGTLIGAVLSQRYARSSNSNSDPVICGVGLLAAAPFIYLAVFLPPISMLYTWISIFLGELFIGFTWAPATAMLLYVTLPTQRSFAAGIQTLTSHLLGDALSPFIVGWLAGNLYYNNDFTRGKALQYALYPTSAFAIIGAVFFGISAKYVIGDRRMVEIQEHEQIGSAGVLPEPSEAYFGQVSSSLELTEGPIPKDTDASPRPADQIS